MEYFTRPVADGSHCNQQLCMMQFQHSATLITTRLSASHSEVLEFSLSLRLLIYLPLSYALSPQFLSFSHCLSLSPSLPCPVWLSALSAEQAVCGLKLLALPSQGGRVHPESEDMLHWAISLQETLSLFHSLYALQVCCDCTSFAPLNVA